MFRSVNPQSTIDRLSHHFFAAMETHDPETHNRSVTGWSGRYERVGRDFHGELTELWLWPLQVVHERLHRPCFYQGSPWSGALAFFSIVEARGNMSVQGRPLETGAVTVLPCGLEVDSFSSGPMEHFTIAVDQSALVDYARQVLGIDIPGELLSQSLSITEPEAVGAYHSCVASILDELTARPALLDEEQSRRRLRDRLLNMLIQALVANLGTARSLSPPSTRSYIVEKAVQYMDARVADPLVMVDLCHAIRVCPRTLRYSFEAVVGVAPTQYLLSMRLGRVRRALLQANTASNVQCVAAQFGFSHMGRFARFYQDAFGELPSDTLRRRDIKRARVSAGLDRRRTTQRLSHDDGVRLQAVGHR